VFRGNPGYGYYFRAFHKLLKISQKVARNFSKSCSKVQASKNIRKLLFVSKVAQILLRKPKRNHFVALFLYFVWCENMQTVQEKLRFLSIFEQFCGVTSVAR